MSTAHSGLVQEVRLDAEVPGRALAPALPVLGLAGETIRAGHRGKPGGGGGGWGGGNIHPLMSAGAKTMVLRREWSQRMESCPSPLAAGSTWCAKKRAEDGMEGCDVIMCKEAVYTESPKMSPVWLPKIA